MQPTGKPWAFTDSSELYRIEDWGQGYFEVAPNGHVVVRPDPEGAARIDLMDVVEGLAERGLYAPVLLRFPGILAHRLRQMGMAFDKAIAENNYRGRYIAVYPIKVNQQRPVVEEVYQFSEAYQFGLEAGSKPELLAVLAMHSANVAMRPVICNGYKDDAYIEAVILATKLGRTIIPVVENFSELRLIIKHAKKYGVKPRIGVRVKLESQGSGRWRDSVGPRSKFGLFVSELLQLVDVLKQNDLLDCLQLLHCHPGSQITNIRRLKDTLVELSHIYTELVRMGAKMGYIDVGGGLGVDYDGSRTNFSSSMNYTLQEYASDIVYHVEKACEEAGIEHPTIVSESGRAMTAYSSVLIFNVIGHQGVNAFEPPTWPAGEDVDEVPPPIRDLQEAHDSITEHNLVESYHDAVQARAQSIQLFSLGYLSLPLRGLAERLFWSTCAKALKIFRELDPDSRERADLELIFSETFFCNFSVFQSLPDCWAVGQLFPMMPIHRLGEQPTRKGILADITCDSDGKIDKFIGPRDVHRALDLHQVSTSEPYYLGAFLVGAYQETLGDLHNLFGDTHVVHIKDHPTSGWAIERMLKGETAGEVLKYVHYDVDKLVEAVSHDCENAVREGRMTLAETRALMRFYESELGGYTYLVPENA